MRRTLVSLAALLLVVPACGGGGAPAGPSQTVAISSTDALTGDAIDGGSAAGSVTPVVGDSPSDEGIRAFYSFDLSDLPAGAVVTQAVFTTAQTGLPFGTPYADLGGAVFVDHVDLDGALDPTDFDSPALTPSPGILSDDPAPGARSLAVAAQVAADLTAGRATSEYRLAFLADTDSDGNEDTIQLEDAFGGGGTVPTLTITYTVP